MPAAAGQLYSYSVEEQTAAVAPWDVTLRQLSHGPFLGCLQFASLGDILIYRDCWSQCTVARAALPRNYFMLGSGLQNASGIDWCGATTDHQLLALALPDTETDFIMPANSHYVALLLPVRYLNLLFPDAAAGHSPRSGIHHLHCNPVLGSRLIQHLTRVIDSCREIPGMRVDPARQQALETDLLDNLAALGSAGSNGQRTPRLRARRQILQRALEAGEDIREKVSVPQFARQLAVSQRSLELAFREFLNITPRQYLNYRRMHGAHGELQGRPPESRCVTEIANAWGFSELGRFAGDYNQLFGELPSATLKRAPAPAPHSLRDVLL